MATITYQVTIGSDDLRHTAGTLMFENGEYPKAVSERLGHSKVGITMELYRHVTRGQQQGIAQRLDGMLRGAPRSH